MATHLVPFLGGDDGDLVTELDWGFQDGTARLGRLLVLIALLGHARVGSVDVVLEQFVLTESGGAHRALVGEVGRLQSLAVVFRNVIQQLPLVHLQTPISMEQVPSLSYDIGDDENETN